MKIKEKHFYSFLYILCAVIMFIAMHYFLNNYHHMQMVNQKVVVSDLDSNYSAYKDNISKMESMLLDYKGDKNSNVYRLLSDTVATLKQENVFRLVPNTKLTYQDLYTLNEYFIESVYNKTWVKNISIINQNGYNQQKAKSLVNKSVYYRQFLKSNVDVYYNINAVDLYDLILQNYYDYSLMVLDVCEGIGD